VAISSTLVFGNLTWLPGDDVAPTARVGLTATDRVR
jgi:hypothetical protein